MKVKFTYYHKYNFHFVDEQGNTYVNFGDANDIYRLEIKPEMEMEEENGKYYIDGLEFERLYESNI